MTPSAWAVVVAAGSGTRFGTAKQYERLGDRRVLDWAVAAAGAACRATVLVVPPERAEAPEPAVDAVVAGGTTRSASVRAGLRCVPDDVDVVVVHDAARPLATAALFRRVIAAVRDDVDGAVPALAVADTVKRVRHDGVVEATVDRAGLVAVQTPQAFRTAALRAAHAGGPEGTDDAALVEAIGGRVVVVAGEHGNKKLTVPEDMTVALALLPHGYPSP